MRVAAYVRVSTDLQADHGYSVSEQTDRIKAYCKARDWDLVKIYTDPGFTGKNLDRPAMQQLIKECTLYDLVLVNKLDRLSRSQKDTLYLIEDVFRANGVQFASMSENFDTTTPLGMAMVGILSVFAQLEREQIKERMHMGRVGRAKKGLWRAGSNPPVGYDYIDGHLILKEDEAVQIRLIYEMFLAGMSMHAISKFMHENYANKYRSWNQTNSVSIVLRNPLYLGKIHFEGEIYEGDHEAIIDQETFDRAQQRYAQIMRKNPQYQNPFKAKYLLTGIIFCGECGSRYSMSTCKSKKENLARDKKRYNYYGCRGRCGSNQEKIKSNHCKNRYYKQEELDQAIIAEVLKLNIENVKPKVIEPPIDNAAQIKKIDRQISKLLDLYSIDGIELDEVKAKIEKLNADKEKLSKPPISPKMGISRKEAKELVRRAKDIFDHGDLDKKRALLSSIIRKVVLYKDHIEIDWNF